MQILKTTTTGDSDVGGSSALPYLLACQLNEETLFALSADEATRSAYGFGVWDSIDASNRRAALTNNASGKVKLWGLRSPFSIDTVNVGDVGSTGQVGAESVSFPKYARPAFNLKKNDILFNSTAVGGKSAVGMDSGLEAVKDAALEEWKLTILDSSRSFAVATTAVSSDSVRIAYNHAKTGPKEYISAAIVDDMDTIMYYGRIKNSTTASGTATINIPAGVTLGSDATLYVFNEEYNGDYRTDYASNLNAISTVNAYAVDYALTSMTTGGLYSVTNNNTTDYTAMLAADTGYKLPSNISVKIGGTSATLAASKAEADSAGEYYYNSSTGELFIAKVNGPVEITAAGVAKTYAISASPSTLDFDSLTEGYTTAPDAQPVSIKNNGSDTITGYSITGGDTDFNVTYASSAISAGGTSTFAVKPSAGLSAGTHAKTLTIETSEGSTAKVDLNFVVNEKPSPGGYVPICYKIKASSGNGGSISPTGSSTVAIGNDMAYAIKADKEFKIQEVLVDGVSVGAVSAYTFQNIQKAHTITASFQKITAETVHSFSDVASTDWFYDNVRYVSENGLMTGTDSNMFNPNGTTTRAMLVTVLHRMSGEKGNNTNSFSDVSSGVWYENAAAWAAANGIVGGVGNNQFAPENALTREQLAVMLYNYAKYKGYDVSVGENTNILSYKDALNISDYAYAALQWACGAGIMNGNDSGNLNPQSPATRAEVAAMLERFIKSNNPKK